MTRWFALTLFTSAALLFVIQPLAGRAVLPWLGGAAATWAACLLFFQVMLLGGYAWAHVLATRLPFRAQVAAQLGLLAAGAWFLPPAAGGAELAAAATNVWPAAALVGHLLGTLGLPVFALAATAPLLQRWFARTDRPGAADPYFLYVASNAGSLLALLAYPFVVERWLGLAAQRGAWAAGYLLLLGLIAAAAWLAARHGAARAPAEPEAAAAETAPPARTALRWIALAAVASSLSLGVTLHLATDLASTPLLWVVPLALYLLSFILAFGRSARPAAWADRALPFAVVAVVYTLVMRATQPAWLIVAVHLLTLLLAGTVLHGRLAAERPPAAQLTGFYLCLAAGGALGGLFNAVAAPAFFRSAAEYPLALLLACALRPEGRRASARGRDAAWAALVALVTVAVMFGPGLLPAPPGPAVQRALPAVPLLLAVCWPRAVGRTTAGLTGALVTLLVVMPLFRPAVHTERSFYGITTVRLDAAQGKHTLIHGSTIHGAQFRDPERRREPLTYYHRAGPLGDVFGWLARQPGPRQVAVVGLGAGSMAAYAQRGETWTFYEIDPASIRVAMDPALFTFLADAPAELRVDPGDARLRLAAAADGQYALIALDAFSSDAIPLHLLTREALELYLRKLRPGGVLAFHLSNRYAHLEPALAALAREAGLVARLYADADESEPGKFTSDWLVMARRPEDLAPELDALPWLPPEDDGRPAWTDDRASILSVLELW
jgi:SAM-dependent methyltransferase